MINLPSKSIFAVQKLRTAQVNGVEQTVKHSDEKVAIRKEVQSTETDNINNAENNTVQQRNEDWRKSATLILGAINSIKAYREKDVQKKKNQSQMFSRSKS